MREFMRILGLAAICSFLQTGILLAQGTQTPTRKISLPGGSARASSTPGIAAETQAGYAIISKASGSSIYGTSVLSYAPDGVVISEVGVPPSPQTTSARIFIDYRSLPLPVDTGFAVVNRGAEKANITYTLRDLSAKVLTTGNGTLAAGAHDARFISQLGEVAPDFILPGDFAINTQFGSLEIASDRPVSIIALRMTTNQKGEVRFTTTPVADLLSAAGSGPIYFPQFVDGGGYTTAVNLLNTSNAAESGELRILDNDGKPLPITTKDGRTSSVFRYESIPPAGGYMLRTDGSPNTANAGWVILTPDAGTSTPVGAGIFSFSQDGVLVSEAGVPSSSPAKHARVYVDISGGRNTGLAIANPTGAAVNVVFNAFQTDGKTATGSGSSRPLKPNGHDAAFADQIISGLPAGFKGELDITCQTPIAALALRSLYNANEEFLITTFPIADIDQSPVMPIVFPQIADGGGYTTEMIFLSTTGDSSATVDLFGNTGSPLQVPLSLTIATGPYGIEFVMLPSGEFQMGSQDNYASERPVHTVSISHFFELGEFEITQLQWQTVMGFNPSKYQGNNHPVEMVSWNDVQGFIAKLNLLNDGYQYRLPTEAEWEYVCRAGTTGDWAGNLDDIAWYSPDPDHQLGHTYDVGTKLPNAWGLYDMHGNVNEWVQDWYDENYYAVSPAIDPPGPITSSANPARRGLRGGSFGNHPDGNRSAFRHNARPETLTEIVGFRIMREKK
jgi:formylglycine-generating enzyme required for sulfatase activity